MDPNIGLFTVTGAQPDHGVWVTASSVYRLF
jgi:hypothetical protein